MVTFLYLMIHLWLWIVQPYKNVTNMSLFDSLTKPFNPNVNNDSNTMLDSLLFTASNNWNIDSSQIMEDMNKIAFHESKNDPSAIQVSDKTESGYGPGRGLFQFEVGEEQGAHTAVNRLLREYDKRKMEAPLWALELDDSNYDVSGLDPSQQQELFLANLLQMPNIDGEGYGKASFMGVDTDEELADYWAQYHHAGTKLGTDDYTKQRQKFIDDVQYYEE